MPFYILEQNIRPPWASGTCHTCTWHTTASKTSKTLGDVMCLPRPTLWCKGHNPLGSRPARLPLVKHHPLSLVQSPDLSLPLAVVSTSIWWDFSPMEVRTNHLPICTCPLGVSLQHQQICPPWAHKS
jgi:hypothetical protein